MAARARLRAALLAALLASGEARAHEALGDSWWSLDPWVIAGFGLLAFLRPRVPWSFALAVAALFLALVWPLDALSERSLAAHMAQHMLLIAVAAPLLVHARPAMRALATFPRPVLALLRMRPATAFALHGAAIWLGHAPVVIAWAVDHRGIHALEHVALLATALLFAHTVARRTRYGEAAFWTFATMIHTGALGALLTFASRVLFAGYALQDQQLAGLVMWIVGGACYLLLGLFFVAKLLETAGGPARRQAAKA